MRLPCLARRHKLFAFSTLDEAALREGVERSGLNACFAGLRGGVGGEGSTGSNGDKAPTLGAFLAEQGLHPDETAFICGNEVSLKAAAAAGISGWAALWLDEGTDQVPGQAHKTGLAASVELEARAESARQHTEIVLKHWDDFEAELQRREAVAARAYPITTVGALILDAAGHVFLVRTRKWFGKWGIPGGKVDYGESLETALRREVREETGLIAREVTFVMAHESIESLEFYKPRHFILLNYAVKVDGVKPTFALNHESVEGGWMTLTEAPNLDLNQPTRRLLETYSESYSAR
jgi:ADP-ribose pyrophosphatase YjhB (NUDIX family)